MSIAENNQDNAPTLVVGATGMLGGEICRRLAAAGRPVRALVRTTSDPGKVAHLRALGAEVAQGDLRDPASLRSACRGAGAVIVTVSAMPFSYRPGENDLRSVDQEGVLSLVRAAGEAQISHLIYTSFSGNMDLDFPLGNVKRKVERALKDSGLVHTVLRPGYFMEVWFSPAVGFDAANAQAQIYGTGDQQISWISLQDVAAFAVASLGHPAARNATLELGGPEALSPHQVIRLFEQADGRRFQVTHVPPETLQAQLKQATDPMQQSFTALMLCYAQGDPIAMHDTARALGVALTSVEQFVQRTHQPTPA